MCPDKPVEGQRVLVHDWYPIMPRRHPGTVARVGRKLADITYNGRTETFRMIDRRRHDGYGEQQYGIAGPAPMAG